ncbi:TonB-dependent siderophore receptor [Pseudomonas triticifolii]|uniref:TonB-dependent siderophore receptor n=1 Tax=Pseudomonas triticifolii TaxID=2762592 RepID=A0ABR7BEF9_9PSED|nr:TonB-dependent siderophore receptor [Pseudomonas triticifolii]MBC3955566.1 TonB-dependent siderophore receptor [Pseudomonas triticifolii]
MQPPFKRCHSGPVKPFDKGPKSGLTLKGLGLVLSLFVQGNALAEEVEFDIPAQPLNSALKELARQGDLQVLYNPDDVRGKTSSAVHGKLTPEQAATDLLRQAGVAHTLEANTLTLSQTPALQPVTLGAMAIQAKQFGVTTEGSDSYTTTATSLNKTPQSLRETPQSVTVMTRQLMDDRNLTGLDEVMAQTPGITFSQRNFGSHVFSSRGFAMEDESYTIDGVSGQGYSVTGWMTPDMALYDRVEVLRGAAGLLIGAGNPGGAVNLVRKRPTAIAQFSVTTRTGSWDNNRIDLDGSSALNDAGNIRGRFVASYEDRGYFIDELHKTAPLLYGIVETDLDEDTTLTLGLRHQSADIRGFSIFGLPRYNDGRALNLPRSTSLAQDWNRHQTETNEVFGEVVHHFSEDWAGTVSMTHSEGDFDQRVAYAQGAIDPQTLTGSRPLRTLLRSDTLQSTGFDSHLDGHFEAFGLTHQLTVGANGSEQQRRSQQVLVSSNQALDVFNPDHHAIARPNRPAWSSITDFSDKRYGLYSNLRLSLTDSLSLVMGGRISGYDYQTQAANLTTKAQQNHEVTPFVGVIYDLSPEWSWYASYTDIFLPQSSYQSAAGKFLDPAIGASHETGIKGELFDKRLNVSMAVFYVKQKDVAVEDDANSGNCPTNDSYGTCYLNGDIRRSKGFELEASGELLPGLQTLAGYTFNVTRGSDGQAISAETPRHLFRLTSHYTLPGAWHRLTLGAGVSAQSGYSETESTQVIKNPGRAIWDARAAWKIDDHWSIALNGNNLLDRTYYKATGDIDRGNYYGDPRNYVLTLRGDF